MISMNVDKLKSFFYTLFSRNIICLFVYKSTTFIISTDYKDAYDILYAHKNNVDMELNFVSNFFIIDKIISICLENDWTLDEIFCGQLIEINDIDFLNISNLHL